MRRAGMPRVAAACGAIMALAATRAVGQEGTWALTNARIETVTRGVIERGTIVIRDGLIAAVGADVTAPADARVVDLTGRTVYPGLIDLTSTLGLAAPPAPTGGPGGGGGGGGAAAAAAAAAAARQAGRTFVGLEPSRLVSDELNPTANDVKAARDAGFTVVLSAPGRGAFRGRSALVPLQDSVSEREIVRSPVALHMGYQGAGGGFGSRTYPGTLLGVIAYERQKFYDARRQALLLERYRTNPRGMQRPANDDDLSALIPVVKGELPVFFAANNENEIRRAINMGREFGIQTTIVGATEGFLATDALRAARRPVVVSVDFPRAPDVTGWSYRSAQRHPANDSAMADSIGRRIIEGNAATLMNAGIRFALASGGRPAEFLPNVRKAIAAGLPRDTALAAMTIRAAEIAGVAEQLGSIEQGKAANLVVSEGDLLGDSAKIRLVFVDGIRYVIDAPAASAARGRGPGGRGGPAGAGDAAAMAQVGGTWDLTINSPQGQQQSVMTAAQDAGSFTGNMASQMGTAEISGGQIEGHQVSWSMTLSMGGQSIVLRYSGEVNGTHMTGTVAAGDFGSFPFTGEKRP